MAQGLGRALTRLGERATQAGVVLALTVVTLPALIGLGLGLRDAAVIEALARAAPWWLLARSLALAIVVVVAAVSVGVPLGLLLGRTDVPLRRAALWLHALPATLPPLVLALGGWELLSPWRLAQAVRGLAGTFLFQALAFTPVVTILVAVASAAVDPAQVEAARTFARPWLIVARILLPAVRPAVALGALLVATLSLAELGVPAFLGVDVYATAVFARLGGADAPAGEAVALVLPLLVLAVGLAGLERRVAGARALDVLGMRRVGAPLPLGTWRRPLAVVAWLLALAPWVPLLGLAWAAWAGGLAPAELTRWVGGSLRVSAGVGVAVATAVVLAALILGHALGHGRALGRWSDAPAVALFLVPGGALGLAYATASARPPLSAFQGTFLPLILALVARYLVLGLRAVAVSVRQGSPRVEEAAACFGASYLRRLRDIVVPLHAHGLTVAWALVFVATIRDLETASLLYPPGGDPLVVRLFTLEANGPPHVLAGLGLVQVLLAAVVIGGMAALSPRSSS